MTQRSLANGCGLGLLCWAGALVVVGALWGFAWADTAALACGVCGVGVLWRG